jgi:hypothetical protein
MNKKIDEVKIDASKLPEGEKCLTCEEREECPGYLHALGLDDLATAAAEKFFEEHFKEEKPDKYYGDGFDPNPIPEEEAKRLYLDPSVPLEERFHLASERHAFFGFEDDSGAHLLLRFANHFGLHLHNRGRGIAPISIGIVAWYDHLAKSAKVAPDDMWQIVALPSVPHVIRVDRHEGNQETCRLLTVVPYLPPVDINTPFDGETIGLNDKD